MRKKELRVGFGCLLLVGVLGIARAQSPGVVPSVEEAHAVWKAFWAAVIVGDLMEARRHVHSQRQHLFPGNRSTEELRELASQMAHCRLDVTPLLAGVEEVLYRVMCEHRGEKAESQVGLRRDADGTWRLSTL